MTSTNWYENPICVPFGNPSYDSAYGGSHDMDVSATPNTPVSSIVSGRVTNLSAPSWGKMVCLQLDASWLSLSHGIHYFTYMHLSAINPTLKVGDMVKVGDIIGWSGGCTEASQYAGTSNPTGENFLNDPSQSSQPQIGIALMRGPIYGSGAGWAQFPPIDHTLDPTSILNNARDGSLPISYQDQALKVQWDYLVQGLAYDTGIAKSWQDQMKNFKWYGCPLGGEKNSVTWNGARIKLQMFSGGWCEWHEDTTDGAFGAHWFAYSRA